MSTESLPDAVTFRETVAGKEWQVSLRHGNEAERAVWEQLKRLLTKYPLSPWIATTGIRIERFAVPHSHPVLTLNTRTRDRDDLTLATFLHEQLHWHLGRSVEVKEATIAVLEELRRIYAEVPVGGSGGARTEHSTYLHLIVCCLLEYDALRQLLGPRAAHEALELQPVYRWVYQTVLQDFEKISEVLPSALHLR